VVDLRLGFDLLLGFGLHGVEAPRIATVRQSKLVPTLGFSSGFALGLQNYAGAKLLPGSGFEASGTSVISTAVL
jgi:hypothetical protein